MYVPRISSLVEQIQYCLRALASTADLSNHSVPLFASDGPDGDRAKPEAVVYPKITFIQQIRLHSE
jgi:hypothetical protein